ncbi:MAG TPA: YceI family protein [Prolixibacteraceae bacterium]|nr:YceI family protein [Prolixibacteraceae bacterium]
MLKKLFILVLFTASVNAFGQGKFISKNAYISFYSSTPLEDILGESNEAVSILNGETGEVGFQALMTTFHFKRALMEEHFNENYIESDKFPKSKFNGKIENFNKDMLKSAVTNITITGQLSVHGVEKTITVPGTLGMENGKLVGSSKFKVVPEDYGITIPSLVRDKIAKEFEVTVKSNYAPYGQ